MVIEIGYVFNETLDIIKNSSNWMLYIGIITIALGVVIEYTFNDKHIVGIFGYIKRAGLFITISELLIYIITNSDLPDDIKDILLMLMMLSGFLIIVSNIKRKTIDD